MQKKSSLIQIVNAIVLDPVCNEQYEADILISGDKIVRIDKRWLKPSVTLPDTRIIDAGGAYIAPALWDMHVHLREPGDTHKETLASGAKAAVRGGIARMLAMPNTRPPVDNVKTLTVLRKKADVLSRSVDIDFAACITRKRSGKKPVDFQSLNKSGTFAFSDDGSPVGSQKILKHALKETAKFSGLVIDHSEDMALSGKGVINEGDVSKRMGVPGISAGSEYKAIQRNIKTLRSLNKGKLHISHVSTAESIELIRTAKASKLNGRLTCEVCPHHFSLIDEDIEKYGTNAKMKPPLRSKKDIEAIYGGLNDGTIDAIASDHAPHSQKEKKLGLLKAPFGIIGMETMLPVTITYLVKEGILNLLQAISLMTIGPARVLGMKASEISPGEPANLVIFDPKTEVIFKSFSSKSRNSPFLGRKLFGKVLYTIHKGHIHNFKHKV
ncbi:dihydroorotase [Elusimicrobiota bacterium]